VVPTTSLLDQWWVGLQEDLGVEETEIAVYAGGPKPAGPKRVNLVVVNTGREWTERISEAAVTFLIVDECHRAGSPLNARALAGSHQSTLGISATPEREGDSGFEAVLIPTLGDIIFDYGYNEARRDGVISPFDLVNVEAAMSASERDRYERLSSRIAREMTLNKGGDEGKLKPLLLARAGVVACARLRVPVAVKLLERYPGRRALVFHERVAAAIEIYHLLIDRGHSATIYHSRMDDAVRRDNLRQYRRGVFDVLVTCRALDEGIDVPQTEVAIVAASTGSARQRIQRLGRALRPASKKDSATVITIFVSEQERRRLLEEEQDLVEASSVTWERAEVI